MPGTSPRKKLSAKDDLINEELMMRLASGKKANVDKKTMRLLTIKNYEKLPEIIKKKQEQ